MAEIAMFFEAGEHPDEILETRLRTALAQTDQSFGTISAADKSGVSKSFKFEILSIVASQAVPPIPGDHFLDRFDSFVLDPRGDYVCFKRSD